MQLHFQVKHALLIGMKAGEGHAAVYQADRRKRALLDDAQQQGHLFLAHAARRCQQQFVGRAGVTMQGLQMGVHEVGGVAGRAQRRLQRSGIQLPPVAGGDIPGTQARCGPRILAKTVLPRFQQGVPGTAQVQVTVPELQVTVVQVEPRDGHISVPPDGAAAACRHTAESPVPAFPAIVATGAGRT